jgi:hypothetical protein
VQYQVRSSYWHLGPCIGKGDGRQRQIELPPSFSILGV